MGECWRARGRGERCGRKRARSSVMPQRAGQRDQVDDGIGGAADRHVNGDGIFKGFAGEDVARLEIFPNHLDNAAAAIRGDMRT